VRAAAEILSSTANRPREFQNRILFLVPDGLAAQTLRDQVKRYLAWESS